MPDSVVKIFLSHSGLDATGAATLQRELERRVGSLGYRAKVFNTSTAADRYTELQRMIAAGANWRVAAKKYEKDLRTYLRDNLSDSTAYVLLVTPLSLSARSRWIEFEIETARRHPSHESKSFFFPVVACGASLTNLPVGAATFQGLDLESPGNLDRLVERIVRGISIHKKSR